MDDLEARRRFEISRRLKSARYLAAINRDGKVSAITPEELAATDALIDEGITKNRVEEIEQMKTAARRSDLDAVIRALDLPDDWFAGLYPADRGRVVSESLGAALLRVGEAAQELRRERGAPGAASGEPDRRRRAAEGGGA